MMDDELMSLLGCPLDPNRPPLQRRGEWLVCEACEKAFPILNGIPLLLPENAVPLSEITEPNP